MNEESDQNEIITVHFEIGPIFSSSSMNINKKFFFNTRLFHQFIIMKTLDQKDERFLSCTENEPGINEAHLAAKGDRGFILVCGDLFPVFA